jgi:Calcium/calmodulin dependent protein kinase II Association.
VSGQKFYLVFAPTNALSGYINNIQKVNKMVYYVHFPMNEELEKEKIKSLITSLADAVAKKDLNFILSIYDTSNPLFSTYEDGKDYTLFNGEKFRKFLQELNYIDELSIQCSNIQVNLLTKDIAIVTGIDKWQTKEGEKVENGQSRFSIVLKKAKDKWKIIHEHFTRIPSGE